jgi:hypothetical protein
VNRTPLRSGGPISRRTHLRRESPQHRARRRVWAAATQIAFRAGGGVCVPQIAPDCTGKAEQGHHKLPRRYRDDSAGNCLPACRTCHDFIHAHPALTRELGFILKPEARAC